MKAIKFTLSGNTAFFKIPDVNEYCFFTFGNIHKVAILGILGAVLGLEGYKQQAYKKTVYPDFYNKLKDLKIAICPDRINGSFLKKVQVFNNATGHGSKEQSGTLIVREQWIENPVWTILVAIDSPISEKLAKHLLNRNFFYDLYLGKNDHFAEIDCAEIIELKSDATDTSKYIESLVPTESITFDKKEPYETTDNYLYQEELPVALDPEYNQYIMENMTQTSLKIHCSLPVYKNDNQNYVLI